MRTHLVVTLLLLAAACSTAEQRARAALARAESAGAAVYAPTEFQRARALLRDAETSAAGAAFADVVAAGEEAALRAVAARETARARVEQLRHAQAEAARGATTLAETREADAAQVRRAPLPEGTALVEPADADAATRGGHAVLVDVRSVQAFAQGHAAGALRLGPLELRHVDLPPARRVLLYANGSDDAVLSDALTELRARERTDVAVVRGGLEAWRARGLSWAGRAAAAAETTPQETVTALDLVDLLQAGGVVVLDVRSAGDFAGGHIRGARRVVAQDAAQYARKLPGLTNIVVAAVDDAAAADVVRGITAAGRHARRLAGGMRDWTAAGHPVVKGSDELAIGREAP